VHSLATVLIGALQRAQVSPRVGPGTDWDQIPRGSAVLQAGGGRSTS